MKVLILTSSFPYRQGDFHGIFIYHQARGQVELGNEVHVVCPHVPGTLFFEILDGINVHRFPYFYPYRFQKLSSDTGMYSALHQSLLAILQLPFFFFSEWWCSWIVMKKHKIDLIHSHWFVPSGFVGAILSIMGRKPHVISSHVLDANLFGKFRVLLPLLIFIVGSADLITTNSGYTLQQINSLVQLRCPSRVIPMGVGVAPRTITTTTSRGHTILFVGRLVAWKGVEILIRAMARILPIYPDSHLIIVGEGDLRESLQHLAEEKEITENVQFCGRVNNEDLEKIYNTASIFVLPSRPYQGLVMEGLGVVLLEAMSYGVLAIGTNVGGIPDIIDDGKNGFLFPAEDEDCLVDRIVTLFSDPVLAEQFRQAGFETVKVRFSWNRIAGQFQEAYDSAVAENSGQAVKHEFL